MKNEKFFNNLFQMIVNNWCMLIILLIFPLITFVIYLINYFIISKMSLSEAEKSELACVYAALILFDDKSEITADKMAKIIKESGNKVDPYYPEFFAGFLKSADINSLLNAAPASSAPAAAPAAPAEEAKDDKKGKKDDKKGKKKEEKKVEEEEEDFGMMDMFG